MIQTTGTMFFIKTRFVKIPKEKRPSNGPYVYPAIKKIKSTIVLLFTVLKMKTKIINNAANPKCIFFLSFVFSSSDLSCFLSNPRMSIQKDEVKAVIAPSTDGNKAEINPMIKIKKIPLDK